MKENIFTTKKKYDVIYADPPWKYDDSGCQGAAAKQYRTTNIDELCKLPIGQIANKNAVLFMWATYPKLEEALKLIKAWGFTYKSIAFQWVKLNRKMDIDTMTREMFVSKSIDDAMKRCCFFGLGRWTRGNTEPCLIAVKGKVKRVSASVGQLVFSPLTTHSAKPPIVRQKIESLIGGGQRIELFARNAYPGWDCWGDEAPEN